jgi:hypothetical protein
MDELLKYVQGSTNPLDVVLKKDESNPLVSKIKYAINAIAQYRGTKEIVIKGETIVFPLVVTDTFDSDTYEIANDFFPAFKSTGKMTVRIARKRWSFVAGYYDKSFPSPLAEATNYSELQDAYANGIISKAKQKRESIVENLLKAFELLGASYINISDQSGFLGEAGVTGTPVTASVNASHSKESLREKNFGKNPLKEKQALEYIPKLEIMPKVVNVIKSRINSNLLSETLIESVSLGVGANLSVAGVGAKASFNMNRKLEIEVKFYDKTEL